MKKILLILVLIIIALGIIGNFIKNDAENEGGQPAQSEKRPEIVHIGPICPDIISVTITECGVEYGRQRPYAPEKGDVISPEGVNMWLVRDGKPVGALVGRAEKFVMTLDRLIGEKIDTLYAEKPEGYLITSCDDPDLANGRQPYMVYRKTRPTDYARTGAAFEAPLEHTLYLKLLKPLMVGRQYSIEFKNVDLPKQTFTYDPSRMRSEAVHISHIGFRPDDPSKTAFLSLWMGSGGPVEFKEGTTFHVLDDKTGETVYKGGIKVTKRLGERDEDISGNNFNGTDVYMMDFGQLKKPGRYRVYVEGVGCSYPFDIAHDVWRKAFYVSVRGLYHQRSGIELGPPHTTFKRPRNFHPSDGVEVYATKTTLFDTPNAFGQEGDTFSKMVSGRTDEIVPNVWGGYCDAGDWDRRIHHLSGAKLLLELYESFPRYFEKIDLNIPGSREEYPDVIREALWGIDFYRRLQTREGGVRGGVESEGHPRYGETSWQYSLMAMTYAPDVWSTYLYAASAAYASHVLKKFNFKNSGVYGESAIRAMGWAEEKIKTVAEKSSKPINDARNMASAELFRLTGSKKWHDVFNETTALKDGETEVFRDKSNDQAEAVWVYYNTDRPGMDRGLKARCRRAITMDADFLMDAQRKTGFRWAKSPWRPAIANQFTTPDCVSIARAHAITQKEEYLQSLLLSTQTGAGANPLNMCYTTGLGHKSPRHAMHFDSRFTGQPVPPGITVFGPLDPKLVGGVKSPLHKTAGQFCYPHVKDWPVIESYWDIFWYPEMCEFTIHQSIAPNAYIWGYLAARR